MNIHSIKNDSFKAKSKSKSRIEKSRHDRTYSPEKRAFLKKKLK